MDDHQPGSYTVTAARLAELRSYSTIGQQDETTTSAVNPSQLWHRLRDAARPKDGSVHK